MRRITIISTTFRTRRSQPGGQDNGSSESSNGWGKKLLIFLVIVVLVVVTCMLTFCGRNSLGLSYAEKEDGTYEVSKCFPLFRCPVIPETYKDKAVTGIGKYAFSDCQGLRSVTIPNSVVTIEEGAFLGTGLREISIPNSVNYIGRAAFQSTRFRQIELPRSLTTISISLFRKCITLTSIEIPENVKTIECFAFEGCEALTDVVIPKSVTRIEAFAFEGCNNLQYREYKNGLYLGNETIPYLYLVKMKDPSYNYAGSEFEFADGVRCIGDKAFAYCMSLKTVFIPAGVTSVGGSFTDTALEHVYYGGSTAMWYSIGGTSSKDYVVHCSNEDIKG